MFRLPYPEEKLGGIFHHVLDEELGINDVFISGKHQERSGLRPHFFCGNCPEADLGPSHPG